MSADGSKLAAADSGGYIYTSTDSGVTWTERTSAGARNWQNVVSSAGGTKLAATDSGGYIYTSADSGVTWTEQTSAGSRSWYGLASSANGMRLLAADGDGYLYISNDSGVTWTEQTSAGSRFWSGVALSSDGSKAIVAGYADYLYSGTAAAVQGQADYPYPNSPTPVTPSPSLAPLSSPVTPKVIHVNPSVADAPSNRAPDEVDTPVTSVAPVFDLQTSPSYQSGKGDHLRLNQGQIVAFSVAKSPHTVTIDSVTATSVTFTLRSTPQTVKLNIGESGKYDVNDDGHPDISATLIDITNGVANISFAAITTPIADATPVAKVTQSSKNGALMPIVVSIGLVIIVIVISSVILKKQRRSVK
jgi:hypothetical protein